MLKQVIFDTLLEALGEKGDFDIKKPLILAVSGGVDSLCLAHALRDSQFKLIVAHFDHGLRAVSEAQATALGVMMADWGLPFVSCRMDVDRFARQEKTGIEEAARIARYQFLYEVARDHQAQAIVLGHHADDQVETVLMHFLRGSGMAGLTGMRPRTILKQFDENIPLIRPLLSIWREELETYAKVHRLEVLEDESNQTLLYYRNRLRHQLIPELETLNPGFKLGVTRAAEVLRGDEMLLQKLEEAAYQKTLLTRSENELILSNTDLQSLEPGLIRRVIRRALHTLWKSQADFGFRDIEAIRQFVEEGSGEVEVSGGIKAVLIADKLHLLLRRQAPSLVDYPQMPQLEALRLTLNETVPLNEGWQLRARMIDATTYHHLSESEKQDPMQAFINPRELEWPLCIRAGRVGERWKPLGLAEGTQKLSHFFVNNKTPRLARAKWPLLLSGESVVWLVGLRISQTWRLLGDEDEILHLSLTRKS